MEFVDSAGTRYQFTESTEAPAPAKNTPVWPWVVGGLDLAGGLVWMASQTSRKTNPTTPEIEALIAEARDPDTEWDRLWALFNHPEVEVRHALIDNPNLCPTDDEGKPKTSLLEKLAKEFPEEVAAHPLFVLRALIEPNDEFQWVVMEVMQRTKDVGLIEQLLSTWGSWSSDVRFSVAKNPSTPGDILRLLGNEMTESNGIVRQGVALNPRTPVDVLRLLGNSETESQGWVRAAVAKNPNTPVDVLRILGNKQTESRAWVRQLIASNHNAPEDILRILGNEATEPDWGVRQGVASNPSAPEDVLRILGNEATESHVSVRHAVMSNPSTPEDVLRILGNPATESHAIVRQGAQKALADRGLA